MAFSEIIQFGGVVVAFIVAGRQLIALILYGRGGPPELRTIREQIDRSNELLRDSNDQLRSNNDRMLQLLQRMINHLDERG